MESKIQSETEWVSVEKISVQEGYGLVVKDEDLNIHEASIGYASMGNSGFTVNRKGIGFDRNDKRIRQPECGYNSDRIF